MKFFKRIFVPAGFFICVSAVFFFLFQGVSHSEVRPLPTQTQKQIQTRPPASTIPATKHCPDLKVSFNVVKSGTGLVTINGTIANVGTKDYTIPSEGQYFMNYSVPPKTYSQTGVSEQLGKLEFSSLKKGSSLPFNCTYQIPNFDKWIDEMVEGTPKRMFTLRVVKKDMSSFKPGEECNGNNNSKGVELKYQEKPH